MTTKNTHKLFSDMQLGSLFKAACKARDKDRIVSMIRVLGAMQNWCALEDCGKCPLAVDGCTVDTDRHVEAFLDKYSS